MVICEPPCFYILYLLSSCQRIVFFLFPLRQDLTSLSSLAQVCVQSSLALSSEQSCLSLWELVTISARFNICFKCMLFLLVPCLKFLLWFFHCLQNKTKVLYWAFQELATVPSRVSYMGINCQCQSEEMGSHHKTVVLELLGKFFRKCWGCTRQRLMNAEWSPLTQQ